MRKIRSGMNWIHRQLSQPLFLRATTADVRYTQSAAVKHSSIRDTHGGQGAICTDRVNKVWGAKTLECKGAKIIMIV